MHVLFIIVLATIYLLPSIGAFLTWHPDRYRIFALNVIAGWTVIGWIDALYWSVIRPGDYDHLLKH